MSKEGLHASGSEPEMPWRSQKETRSAYPSPQASDPGLSESVRLRKKPKKMGRWAQGLGSIVSLAAAFSPGAAHLDQDILGQDLPGEHSIIPDSPDEAGKHHTQKTPQEHPYQPASQTQSRPTVDIPAWPIRGESRITGGPHAWELGAGWKTQGHTTTAIDVAPLSPVPCPPENSAKEPVIDDSVQAVSPFEGMVVIGNNKDYENKKTNSIVEIRRSDGVSIRFVHLANIPVHQGETVSAGEVLGSASCEIPEGGRTTGAHIHMEVRQRGKPVDIKNVSFDGIRVWGGDLNYQGGLRLPTGENITADTRVCADSNDCSGIINVIPSETAEDETSLAVRIFLADGTAAKKKTVELYRQEEDIAGEPATGEYVGRQSTGQTGEAVYEGLEPGRYIATFPTYNRIFGERFPGHPSPGISGIEVKPGQENTADATAGRMIFQFSPDPENPHLTPYPPQVCISALDQQERPYNVVCSIAQKNNDGSYTVLIEIFAGNYQASYEWGAKASEDKPYGAYAGLFFEAEIGEMPIVPGQISKIYCILHAHRQPQREQPSDCSILPQ